MILDWALKLVSMGGCQDFNSGSLQDTDYDHQAVSNECVLNDKAP